MFFGFYQLQNFHHLIDLLMMILCALFKSNPTITKKFRSFVNGFFV